MISEGKNLANGPDSGGIERISLVTSSVVNWVAEVGVS